MLSIRVMTPEAALTHAKQTLGGNAGIASHFKDLTPQAVSQWKRIPHKRLQVIASLLQCDPAELRPDLAEALAA
jgi:hypothetical protein